MMIFDHFPDRKRASAFASYVTAEWERTCQVFDSQEESNKVDIFPFELVPPIVLVERDYETYAFEDEITKTVESFGGVFAGT